jgi:hypothetical protein
LISNSIALVITGELERGWDIATKEEEVGSEKCEKC